MSDENAANRMPHSEDIREPLAYSIVTVCRNAERSIARAIESVAEQRGHGRPFEHIVVDGQSTDGTLRLLKNYPHLRTVSEPDGGIYDAMNKGVAMARGSYVAFLNADDWYEPNTLALVGDAFRQDPQAGVVYGDVRRWAGDVSVDVVKPTSGVGRFGTVEMPVHHPATFVQRDIFARLGGFDLAYRHFADFDWIARVVRAGTRLQYCPAVLANFTLGGVSTMHFAVSERFRVLRASGAGVPASAWTVAYSCGVVLRNRARMRL